ncbi:MAG: FliH/SctL family protein [Clostridium sp.]
MQLSYNLIKNGFTKTGEKRVITTDYVSKAQIAAMEELAKNQEQEEVIEKEEVKAPKIDPEELLRKYEEIGKRIVQDAENEKKALLLKAQQDAINAEKDAYEKGHEQGMKNGYDDGYKKAYDETIENAQSEAADIVEKAENLLRSAQNDYAEYLNRKRNEIIKIALNIAESITRKNLSEDDSLNEIVEEAFKISKGEESIILRVNSVHVEELKKNCERWKLSYAIKKEIFVIADDAIEPGNAILEKPSGIVKVGVDVGLEQMRKAILG